VSRFVTEQSQGGMREHNRSLGRLRKKGLRSGEIPKSEPQWGRAHADPIGPLPGDENISVNR
jgi:hypothetical protein